MSQCDRFQDRLASFLEDWKKITFKIIKPQMATSSWCLLHNSTPIQFVAVWIFWLNEFFIMIIEKSMVRISFLNTGKNIIVLIGKIMVRIIFGKMKTLALKQNL